MPELSGSGEAAGMPPRGVIHDLGYRPYVGQRGAEGTIAWALFRTGLRNAFGLGRSAKSKILPFALLGLNLLPAIVMVSATALTSGQVELIDYPGYAGITQIMVSVFVAAQSPILFSRDLRHGSIWLYLARPLRPVTYAVVRWLSLWAALLIFLVTPVLLLLVGALLSESDVSDQLIEVGQTLMLVLLLAAVLAGIGGLISSWSTRRGFATMGIIVVLLLGAAVVATVQGIAFGQSEPRVGEIAGLFSPYTLYRGTVTAFFPTPPSLLTPPSTDAMLALYFAVSVALAAGLLALVAWRFRRVVRS